MRGKNFGMAAFPAGRALGVLATSGGVHAIDGDGGSLCERLAPGDAVQIDELVWSDIGRRHRCRHCQLLMTTFGMGHL